MLVVATLPPATLAKEPRIKQLRALTPEWQLVQTPRYKDWTEIVQSLLDQGLPIAEIAGNHEILITVIAPKSATLPEMRRVGENPRHQRQVADAIDQDAEVEIAAAGEQAEHAIGKVEHAEQLEEAFRGAARGQRRRRRPQRRDQMKPVGIPGAPEQAEDHVVLIDKGRDISSDDHKAEQSRVAPSAQSDDIHDLSSLPNLFRA
jgi:hypothetical protein